MASTRCGVSIAIAWSDVLACAFARLLLWTLPDVLPLRTMLRRGYQQYFDAWRPGRPRPETWDAHFAAAWDRVEADGPMHTGVTS